MIDQEKLNYDFSAFYVSVVPSGLVTIWISGAEQLKLLAQFQAKKTDIDWEEFDKCTLATPIKYATREDFVSETIAESYTPEEYPCRNQSGHLTCNHLFIL